MEQSFEVINNHFTKEKENEQIQKLNQSDNIPNTTLINPYKQLNIDQEEKRESADIANAYSNISNNANPEFDMIEQIEECEGVEMILNEPTNTNRDAFRAPSPIKVRKL